MSDETVINVVQREDELWDVVVQGIDTTRALTEGIIEAQGVTFDDALDVAKATYAEHGYEIYRLKDQQP